MRQGFPIYKGIENLECIISRQKFCDPEKMTSIETISYESGVFGERKLRYRFGTVRAIKYNS